MHVPRFNAVGAVFQLALGQIGEIFSFLYGNFDLFWKISHGLSGSIPLRTRRVISYA